MIGYRATDHGAAETYVGGTDMHANTNNTATEYDGDLQMFRAQPLEANLETLRFLRWLAEHGHLEHAVAGSPSGEHVVTPTAA